VCGNKEEIAGCDALVGLRSQAGCISRLRKFVKKEGRLKKKQ
jgi:hypothetical protein